jgi:hypothetical protein
MSDFNYIPVILIVNRAFYPQFGQVHFDNHKANNIGKTKENYSG